MKTPPINGLEYELHERPGDVPGVVEHHVESPDFILFKSSNGWDCEWQFQVGTDDGSWNVKGDGSLEYCCAMLTAHFDALCGLALEKASEDSAAEATPWACEHVVAERNEDGSLSCSDCGAPVDPETPVFGEEATEPFGPGEDDAR